MWRARSVDAPADAMGAVQGPTVFAYRFDWDEEPHLLWLDMSELLGAAHGMEIPFVFGRLRFFGLGWPIFDGDNAETDMALSRAMTSYWSAFAADGDPGRGREGTLPRWAPWTPGDGGLVVLDTEAGGGIRMEKGTVSREDVIERIARDNRFAHHGERCRIYEGFVERGDAMSQEELESVLEGHCKEAAERD
jgi:para-nitrobenzyl esterase